MQVVDLAEAQGSGEDLHLCSHLASQSNWVGQGPRYAPETGNSSLSLSNRASFEISKVDVIWIAVTISASTGDTALGVGFVEVKHTLIHS